MKVLISAYTCIPGRGSEPGTGWAWTRGAAMVHDVWLLTHAYNEAAITRACEAEPQLRLHPVYLDTPGRAWKALENRRGVSVASYIRWQVEVARVGRLLHAQKVFDCGHHLTYATDWLPTGLAGVKGLPLVWGPVGGAANAGPRMWRYLGVRSVAFEAVRSLGESVARRLIGRNTARRADLVVCQNPEVARSFAGCGPSVVEVNCAIPSLPLRVSSGSARRRALFVGRLVGWKGPRLAIRVMAHPAASGWTLDLFGTGPEWRACEALIHRLGLESRVRLRGQVSRSEVLEELRRADCLLFPTMHDQASWSVAEAVSVGLPVVCLDCGGPSCLVRDGYGTKVPPRGDVVGALARALAAVPPVQAPDSRWSEGRLPAMLTSWYRTVTGGSDRSTLHQRSGDAGTSVSNPSA